MTLNSDVQGQVIGIDLSLTATGIAVIGWTGSATGVIKSKGKKDDTLTQRRTRLSELRHQISMLIPDDSLVVIEQPAYSQTGGSHHDRSGLWWLVTDLAHEWGFEVAEVSPTTVKKYATGKGNSSKDEVLAQVVKRYPTADVTDNNVADALVLAAMGMRHLGFPVDDLPARNLEAMVAVRWPPRQVVTEAHS